MESKIEKVVKKLKELGENESYLLDIDKVEEPFSVEIGYFVKNGKGKYSIRLRYGITTLLKIRNSEEFRVVKALINYLDKKEEVIKALDTLNGGNSKKTVKKGNILKI